MTGYVAGGWGAAAAIIGLYAWWTVHRERVLRRSQPDRDDAWR